MHHTYASAQSTIKRTFQLWLFSNLGGTLLLTALFAGERLTDYSIGLMAGLVAALVSLCIVPLVLPFFFVMEKLYATWPRRTSALIGVVLFFIAANQLLMLYAPVDSLRALLAMSAPYLVSALLTVLWLYGPALRQPTRRGGFWSALAPPTKQAKAASRLYHNYPHPNRNVQLTQAL